MKSEKNTSNLVSPAMARAEVGVALVLVTASAGLSIFMPDLIASGGIRSAQTFITLSPVFFPRLAFGLLAFLSIGYVFKTSFQIAGADDTTNNSDRFFRAGTMVIIAISYAMVVDVLGNGASTLFMTSVIALFLGLRRWWSILSLSILVPVMIRFIFERLLFISLPRSEIEWIGTFEDMLMVFLTGLLLGR